MNTQKSQNKAFTIIELLTVMSIIVILIGMLVPALNQVRRYAMGVQQRAQLKAIGDGLEMFKSDYDEYPESGALDPMGENYCGAMKLAEAMMGRDLLGYHPRSRFRLDGMEGLNGRRLYAPMSQILLTENLRERKDTYIKADSANAYRLRNLYTSSGSFADANDMYMLFDVFKRNTNRLSLGENKIGMPILYYKSNTNGLMHDPNDPLLAANDLNDSGNNFYNIYDNDELVRMGKSEGGQHALASDFGDSMADFYNMTENKQIRAATRPYRKDTFILISAGWDGEYGTGDDIVNFESAN